MKKRIYTRLAAGLLCGALLLTDAASLDVCAVSNDWNAGEISSLAEADEESDTSVIIDEEGAEKEAETLPEKESEESVSTEETDEEKSEPEGDDVPVDKGDEDVTPPAEEEQEFVSENMAEEDVVAEDELDVNSVMAASEEESEDIASGKSNDISWVIDANGKLTVSGSGDWNREENFTPWYDYRESIKTAEIKVTDMTDASSMFSGCSSLTTLDLSNFDTSNVETMHSMFAGCENLTALDVSNFVTGSVTDMSYMFHNCFSLSTLDLSNFDTGKVTNMSYMFDYCVSLTSLDVSHFNTGKVENMSRMFYSSLNARPDVSHFVTGSVTDMSGMFGNCWGELNLSSFDTSNVENMSSMFAGYRRTTLDLSNFDTSSVTDMKNMFNDCKFMTTLDLSSFDMQKVVDTEDMLAGCTSLTCIYTPRNLTQSVSLPADSGDKWYRSDGTVMTELPKNLSDSITLEKKHTSGEDIASGKSNDISWVIDANGKLTVSGSGDWERDNKFLEVMVPPWFAYRESIKTAAISVTDMTDASGMFYNCKYLTSIDLKNFDTSKVTNMFSMFDQCTSLTTLDLSKFDTSKVTNMCGMFLVCNKLTTLDVSNFNTGSVTNMEHMFFGCEKLTTLDVSKFDTSNVEIMHSMFAACKNLTTLDLSNFNTGSVTNMNLMFSGCSNLTTLDLSNFNTSKVETMFHMFDNCFSLTTLDLSNFNTGNVESMSHMFDNCYSLTALDLSSFDMQKVADTEDMLADCTSLACIYTPRNVTQSVNLPSGGTWYSSDGTKFTKLPTDLTDSIVITKNKKPVASTITAVKKKTAYVCDEEVTVDDITVTYYTDKGTIEKITEGFSTNVDKINATMSTPGKKTLEIYYKELKTMVELTVTLELTQDNVTITLPETVYNGSRKTPVPTVTLKNDETTKLAAGKDYTVSYSNNVNAGSEAVVTVKGMGVFSGTVKQNFTIDQAKVTIKVKDTTIVVGDTLPETFVCEMTGFFNGDEENVTGLSFSFKNAEGTTVSNIDTNQTGTYTVTPTAETVGDNYVVDTNGYQAGTLTIAEERIVYTVTFDMMGHGIQTKPALLRIPSGRLINRPEDLKENETADDGYLFTGWYKDSTCTKAWDFAVDTVQSDTTLYARWVVQTASGGIQIQEIPDQSYTGNAIKPVTAVYAADGTLLKAGKDYTVKYVNNINADQVEATGGVYNSLESSEPDGSRNGFDSRLPYVEIKGKGNHTGTVYRNFHIKPVSISDAGGNAAAGFTLKYADQLVSNAKSVQKPFSSLKYKKAMTAGKDYTVTYSSDNVRDADGNVVTAENGGTWTVTGTYDTSKNNKYTLPDIPKGYSGVFEMIVTGVGNYEGEIKREIYVTDKASLIKNVTISLGKNQKNMPYNEGRAVTLTPGYYNADDMKYYKVSADGTVGSEANANDLFTVKAGKTYLIRGQDYTVTYTDNKAVGTAALTITGIGDYKGSKSATFKITGEAFKANTIEVKAYDQANPNDNDFRASMPYTGSAVTQNKVTLTTKVTNAKPDAKTLKYGEHYTISYKNNIKKGTATMTFTAKPESGYSGSFNKTFKIGAVSLADTASVKVEAAETEAAESAGQDSLTPQKDTNGAIIGYKLGGTVTYSREGAKPSQRIRLSLIGKDGKATGVVLKEGTDYTVSYADNTAVTANAAAGTQTKIPTMTFKGKGNYTGNLKVTFDISEAKMETGGDNLTVTAAATAYDSKKTPEYQYVPKITVKDGKKALTLNKDYTVQYEKCTQADVKAYLDALEAFGMPNGAATQPTTEDGDGTSDPTGDNSNTAWNAVQAKRPYAVITAVPGSGYTTGTDKGITVYPDIYQTKLTGSNLYVVVSEDAVQTTYKGQQAVGSDNQVKPSVTVYYSADTKAVSAAKKDKVTDEAALTAANGTYKLTKLIPQIATNGEGDYALTYGANVTAGKNKGSVTVTGTGMYGGSVTTKFTILQRDVYKAP